MADGGRSQVVVSKSPLLGKQVSRAALESGVAVKLPESDRFREVFNGLVSLVLRGAEQTANVVGPLFAGLVRPF